MVIWSVFLAQWVISLFFQSFFLHRYGCHRMFTMSKAWERTFYLLTFAAQGPSFLNPRAYAVMHRMHHAYSDTPRDPHSPHHNKNVVRMMWETYKIYKRIHLRKMSGDDRFHRFVPEWPAFDRIPDNRYVRTLLILLYLCFYLYFAATPWLFLLFPFHIFMGPLQGMVVNWCGHKYGYVNHRDTGDRSKNTLAWDFILLGELFQNNHHKYPGRVNFAHRWFEVDPAYPLLKLMDRLGIIRFRMQPAKIF